MLYMLTLDEARAALEIRDDKDDALITTMIEDLQGRFEDHCHRPFLRASRTERFDGGTKSLWVRAFPVETGVKVYADEDYEFGEDTLLTENDDYVINYRRGLIEYFHSQLWPIKLSAYQVIYTGGFVAAGTDVQDGQYEMPAGLRGLLRMQLRFEFRNRDNLGKSTIASGGATISLAPARLLPEVADGLSPYRRF